MKTKIILLVAVVLLFAIGWMFRFEYVFRPATPGPILRVNRWTGETCSLGAVSLGTVSNDASDPFAKLTPPATILGWTGCHR